MDFSLKGKRLAELGPTFVVFLCWCSQRLLLQEDIVVQENVPLFPAELLHRFLGCQYFVESVVFGPNELGWGVQRRRRWSVLRHKYKTVAWKSPLNLFASLFVAEPWFGLWKAVKDTMPAWDMFFASSAAEQYDELEWARNRPGCASSSSSGSFHCKTIQEFISATKTELDSAWFEALTDTEQWHLVEYEAVGNKLQVFQLNQNPHHVDTRSTWDNLQTLIKNAGVMWLLDAT